MQIWFSGRVPLPDKPDKANEPPRLNRGERNLIVAEQRSDAIEDALQRMEDDIRKIREQLRKNARH